MFDNFITPGCLETMSNVAFNISDPSNNKYTRKEAFAYYKNMIYFFFFFFATCQMYLFVCLNHFYCENYKGSLFFSLYWERSHCRGSNKSAISSYSSFGSRVNLYDGQLFIPSHVRIMNETNSCKFLEKPLDNVRTKGHTLESEISAGPVTGSCISPVCLIGAVCRYSE